MPQTKLRGKHVPIIIDGQKVGKAFISSNGSITIEDMQTPCPAGQKLLEAIDNRFVLGITILLGGDEF